jgi:hypothetical protein
MSKILIPEIQYWANDLIVNMELNREKMPIPVNISSLYLNTKSFIRLLFDDDYDETSYKYKYLVSDNMPNIARTRIKIFQDGRYYEISDSSEASNIFLLTSDELLILNRLLEYRLNPTTTTLTGITFDSIAYTNPTIDGTAFINYDTIDNDDSKLYTVDGTSTILYDLIYLYLDLKINDNTTSYNNMALLTLDHIGATPKETIECLFESYLIEQMFRTISERTI